MKISFGTIDVNPELPNGPGQRIGYSHSDDFSVEKVNKYTFRVTFHSNFAERPTISLQTLANARGVFNLSEVQKDSFVVGLHEIQFEGTPNGGTVNTKEHPMDFAFIAIGKRSD